MFQANAVGILGLVAVVACWALAVVLYRVGTPDSVARKLSLLLVIEGVTLGTGGYIDLLLAPAVISSSLFPVWAFASETLHHFGDSLVFALYPPFLAAALQTKLTRPFADKRVRIGLWGSSIVLFVVVQWGPFHLGHTLLFLMLALLFGFALVASIQAWREANSSTRDRARSFALAFGIRDVCWGFVYCFGLWQIWSGMFLTVDQAGEVSLGTENIVSTIYALGTLLAVPLIAYGILRTQLFDIDLKIRWTIKQSTVAGVFIAVMFVISEGASQFLSDELGRVTGLLAAGVLMFFLAPLQQFAERVATKAMPNTHNTPEYATFRKMQVYEAAFAEAQMEGGISQKERTLLVHLRDSLGISQTDAEAIEGNLQA